MRVKIHHEGTNILIVMAIAIIAVCLPLWLWVQPIAWAIGVTVVLGVIYLLAVNFFRSPRRHFSGDPKNAVVASADGKVVALEQVYEPEYLKCDCIQLSVFMSIVNVHANWFPVDGEVIYTAHHSGRFMGAYLPKSSVENERSTVVIRTPEGQLVLVRQVAGAVARRIVTYAEPGTDACIEDHLGFIKFGSRVDIYLPLGTETFVNIGDSVTGGVTLVGRLQPGSQQSAQPKR
ncbi:MAG: phosphatidylserine decarboxylase family protein [Muribaculaceae bacterium]|nr:phosphatidylserine decarboxylase family protein [Muribaculaceae bacterium]